MNIDFYLEVQLVYIGIVSEDSTIKFCEHSMSMTEQQMYYIIRINRSILY